MALAVHEKVYPETAAGGFTRMDGSLQFFARVNALLDPSMDILEFGAGRGLSAEWPHRFVRELSQFKGKVQKVVGVDVDPAVLENPTVDETHVFDGRTLPFADASFDLIISDHVFEHLPDPAQSAAELDRVLKPGGWLCARTPYAYSLLAAASSLIPNRMHAKLLRRVQAGGSRDAKDVFPTHYRLNSFSKLKRHFPASKWAHYSYTWSPEPAYHFGSPLIVRMLRAFQYLKAPLGGEVLLVFIQKKS
ncbi:MAG: class I SAM-dependent methyltransferase [Sphingomonadales bacterium]|nr:MAG: class I SAM-dependent methyltransferase [Sphingomonadales bacterium]